MINALKYTEQLEEAGFTPEQAKSSVKVWLDLMEYNFATRDDLNLLKAKMEHEFGSTRRDIDNKLERLEARLTIKLGSMLALSIGLMSIVIQFK